MTSPQGAEGVAAVAPQRHPGTVAVMVACALVLAPTLAYRIGADQGAFAYMAAGVLRGDWPYLGTWEGQFPGLVFLQAAEMVAFGKSVAMFRLFDVLVQLANAYLVFRITEKLSGRVAGFVAAVLFCLIYQGYGPWNTAQREGFGILFVWQASGCTSQPLAGHLRSPQSRLALVWESPSRSSRRSWRRRCSTFRSSPTP